MPDAETMPEVLFTLPASIGGEDGISFLERMGRTWAVVCSRNIVGMECLMLVMKEVKALRVTQAQACVSAHTAPARDRLMDIGWSSWLSEVSNEVAARGGESIGLRHLMISIGSGGPCYEFICRGFYVEDSVLSVLS